MSESFTYSGFATNQEQIGKIAAKYQLTADQIKNTVPVMNDIADTIQAIFKANFESRGRRKGGSWRPLKPQTIERKLRTPGALHIDEPVRLKDRLFHAATGHTTDTFREVKQDHAVIGVQNIPYAAVQRFGGGNKIPARDYMLIDDADRIKFLHLLEDYIFISYGSGVTSASRRPKGQGGYVFG